MMILIITYLISIAFGLFSLFIIIAHRRFTEPFHVLCRFLYVVATLYSFSHTRNSDSLLNNQQCFWILFGGTYFFYVAVKTLKQDSRVRKDVHNYCKMGNSIDKWFKYKALPFEQPKEVLPGIVSTKLIEDADDNAIVFLNRIEAGFTKKNYQCAFYKYIKILDGSVKIIHKEVEQILSSGEDITIYPFEDYSYEALQSSSMRVVIHKPIGL